jgi:hypothetical protein
MALFAAPHESNPTTTSANPPAAEQDNQTKVGGVSARCAERRDKRRQAVSTMMCLPGIFRPL